MTQSRHSEILQTHSSSLCKSKLRPTAQSLQHSPFPIHLLSSFRLFPRNLAALSNLGFEYLTSRNQGCLLYKCRNSNQLYQQSLLQPRLSLPFKGTCSVQKSLPPPHNPQTSAWTRPLWPKNKRSNRGGECLGLKLSPLPNILKGIKRKQLRNSNSRQCKLLARKVLFLQFCNLLISSSISPLYSVHCS